MMGWSLDRPDAIRIDTPRDVAMLKEKLSHHMEAAIDTETTGLNIAQDRVIFWSLSTGDDRYFLEARHLEDFKAVFRDKRRTWIGTHTKYDAHMLANMGLPLAGDLFCTLVMDRLLNPDNQHGLKEVYEREFDEKMATFGETFYPTGKSGKPYKPKGQSLQQIILDAWDKVPDRVVDYASLDAWGSYRVFRRLRDYLGEETTWRGESMWDLYLDFEVPFTKVLYSMERRGMQIDIPYLESLKPQIEKEMSKVKRKLAKAAGQTININSPPQLRGLFFDRLQLKPLRRTPGGEPSTDVASLEIFAKQGCKEAKYVLRYRKLSKIISTYIEGIIAKCVKGRIHGSFNQHVADTARLSSSEPNLQNIPRPDSDEFKIRQAFTARSGYKYVASDYDQLEMFLAAHWSNDLGMIATILEGRDLHSGNAAMIWGVPYEDIVAAKEKNPDECSEEEMQLREYRQFVKVIGFGLLYGKGPNRLASELKIPDKVKKENPKWAEKRIRAESKRRAIGITDQFFAGIPGVAEWIETTHRTAADQKYVETLSGRRRWLHQIMDWKERRAHQLDAEADARDRHRDPAQAMCWCDDCRESRAGERRAVNTIIQGSAADITQAAMIKLERDPELMDVMMVLQVHDEVGHEVPIEIEYEAMARIKEVMEHPGFDLRVPLRCDPHSGANWVEAK
jgi:DNA polymerase-1